MHNVQRGILLVEIYCSYAQSSYLFEDAFISVYACLCNDIGGCKDAIYLLEELTQINQFEGHKVGGSGYLAGTIFLSSISVFRFVPINSGCNARPRVLQSGERQHKK